MKAEDIMVIHKGDFSQDAIFPVLKIIEENPWSIKAHQSGNPDEAAYIDEAFENQYEDIYRTRIYKTF